MLVQRSGNWTAVVLIDPALASHYAWTAEHLRHDVGHIFRSAPFAAIAGTTGGKAPARGGDRFFSGSPGGSWISTKSALAGNGGVHAILFTMCGCAFHLVVPADQLICWPRRFETGGWLSGGVNRDALPLRSFR